MTSMPPGNMTPDTIPHSFLYFNRLLFPSWETSCSRPISVIPAAILSGNLVPNARKTISPIETFGDDKQFCKSLRLIGAARESLPSPYHVIFPHPELCAELFGDLAAGLDVHARGGDHGGGHVGDILLRLADELLDRFVGRRRRTWAGTASRRARRSGHSGSRSRRPRARQARAGRSVCG